MIFYDHWLSWTLIDLCVKYGMQAVVISPGARSLPLTMAAVHYPGLKTHLIIDERGGGYVAVNMARAMGNPIGLICTSGTAVGNYLPAIMEADRAGVPLIVLTADRPPELVGRGANQAIIQFGVYKNYVRSQISLLRIQSLEEWTLVVNTVHETLRFLFNPRPGPVHINCPLDEPVFPSPLDYSKISAIQTKSIIPLKMDMDEMDAIFSSLVQAKRPLITIGRMETFDEQQILHQLVPYFFCPVYTDVGSGWRWNLFQAHYPWLESIIQADPQLLPPPDYILHLGGQLISKHYWRWIRSNPSLQIVQISNRSEPVNPIFAHHRLYAWEIPHFVEQLTTLLVQNFSKKNKVPMWLTEYQLRRWNQQIDPTPFWLDYLIRQMPIDGAIFLGNSSIPRYYQLLSNSYPDYFRPIAINRGVSGIDGTLHSMYGWSQGLSKPFLGILGDLAFYHDMNGLAPLSRLPFPWVICVINNHGGGIFYDLPCNLSTSLLEQWAVAKDQIRLNYRSIVHSFGIEYYRIECFEDLKKVFPSCYKEGKQVVLEIEEDSPSQWFLIRQYLENVRANFRNY